MAKSTLQAIAAVIADRYELKSSDATAFVAAFFDQIREGLAQDKQVKVRGLGTFKLQPVKARESVNVNTGERLVINGHDKMAFTPDNAMKELVNRPFADFETVMIKDGVNIDAIPTPAESATDEDGDECTTETTPTETESESSAENHQPATEERPPIVDEGHTNRDEPQPVVKEVLPTEEEPLQAEEDHQPSVDNNSLATEEDQPHDEEVKGQSDEEKSSSDKEQNEGKDEQPTVVNDQQVIETQTKEESPSAATVPTPPQRVVPRPRKPTPIERFSQLMGDDEDEEQVHSNDDKAIVDDSDEKQESALESEVQSLVSEEVEQESPSFTSTHEATEKECDSPEKAKTEAERETPLSDRADSDDAEESQAEETCSEENIEETLDAEETKDEVRTKGDVESTEENETIKATEEENSTVEEDSKVEENSTYSATEETSLWADPENEDDKMETPQGHLVRNVVLPIVALLSVIAIATGAYYYGKSQQEKPQSSAPQPAKANDSAQAKVENSTKTENKTEAQTDQAQKKEVVAESKETKQVTPEGIDLTVANNYRKLRYGAYRIIGVEKKVVLRPGETMAKVCRRTLGKDMIGYFEAINGQKRRSPGDTILVPKVELRPEYRK